MLSPEVLDRIAWRMAWAKTARAIPLDKGSIRDLVSRLEKKFLRACKAAPPNKAIYWKKKWVEESHMIRTVKGDDVAVHVYLVADDSRRPGKYVQEGSQGTSKSTGRPVVIVKLNGSYTASEYTDAIKSGALRRGIYDTLIHEMTHVVDAASAKYVAEGAATGEYSVSDEKAYYNDPVEVRAYMQQIVDEVQNPTYLRLLPSLGVMKVLRLSPTWKGIEKHLTSSNRKKIMKSVYQSLEGHL